MDTGRFLSGLCVFLSLILHLVDQCTDVFSAFLFYVEGKTFPAAATLTFVFLPGIFIFLNEMRRMCSGKSNFFKALAYLLFSPLWAIVIHFYSFFDPRYVRTALYFKTLEGFLEAGPQLALQLSLLFHGTVSGSTGMVLGSIIEPPGTETINVTKTEFEVFGRIYNADDRYWFGCVYVASVVISFTSIFATAVVFNDIEERQGFGSTSVVMGCSKNIAAKVSLAIPFFFFTLLYRGVGIALLICFIEFWAGVIIFTLFFLNVLSALYIGDDFGRAISYGLWSLWVPVGYNKDPTSPLGYSKVPFFAEEEHNLARAKEAAERSGDRARYFLTSHVLSSLLILGPSLLVTIVLVQSSPNSDGLNNQSSFDLGYLNTIFLPLLGLSLGLSFLLVRPYHRCECPSPGDQTAESDGSPIVRKPKGNIIV